MITDIVLFSLRLVNSSFVNTTTRIETTKVERMIRIDVMILPITVWVLISPYPAVVRVVNVNHKEVMY